MASTESIALSGLLTSQHLLDLTGQNLANVQTPGYHRQVANLAPRIGGDVGLGVEISDIRRQINISLENAITQSTAASGDIGAQLQGLQQLETQLNPTDGSVYDLMQQFFNQLESLAGQPDDTTQRRVVLNTASSLADKLNSLLSGVQEAAVSVQQRIDANVAQVNDLASRIAALDAAVVRTTIQGGNANNLADQRDQLIQQLAQIVDVRSVPQNFGSVNVLAAGVPLVLGSQSLKLHTFVDANNQEQLAAEGIDISLAISAGKLHGLFQLRNLSIADLSKNLNDMTRKLVQTIDGLHATGLGLTGPFTLLHGQRSVSKVNLPLAQAGLSFPPTAGSVFVSVTDQATGARTLTEVAIDSATQSLNDVAAALSGVAHIQAVVDPQSNTLTIVAQPGYAFDFAGRLATAPQTSAMTGTATPTVTGTYTGAANDDYTYKVVGSGTVGLTPNLTLEARNSSGALIASWNIGDGYEPGSALPALNGVSATLSAGTVNDGDTFSSQMVVDPDTAGLLGALGLNSFFSGDLGTLKVRDDLVANPALLAASRSGLPADGGNLLEIAGLREQRLLGDGANTFSEFYANLAADVGSQVQTLQQKQGAQDALGQGLAAEQQSVSGVDPNEELVRLVQYQRSFQLSSRFLAIVNDTLADLMQLVQ